jgi:ZIP family zinc transporter
VTAAAGGVLLPALVGGSAAAAATAIGTLPALYARGLSQRSQDAMLGFGAGVMLAASAFSLVLPGLDAARALGNGRGSAAVVVGLAILAGAALIMGMERVLPHEHFIKGIEGRATPRLQRTWLFVIAICLHNLPEGLAIGVAYANDIAQGNALASGIALQDLPEGLVVALALLAAGQGRALALAVGMCSGLVEPAGAVLGAAVVSAAPLLLPAGLGIAAGAMLYVVSHEIIPESHRQGHENFATGGLMLGFVLMMVLDSTFG